MKTIQLLLCAVSVAVALLFVGGQTNGQSAPAPEGNMDQRLDRLERQVHQLVDQQAQQRLTPREGDQHDFRPATPDRWDGAHSMHRRHGALCAILFVLMIVHILLAIWVFGDIRKRGEGSGLFIILALLAGIPGTILYALVRIGDRRPA